MFIFGINIYLFSLRNVNPLSIFWRCNEKVSQVTLGGIIVV